MCNWFVVPVVIKIRFHPFCYNFCAPKLMQVIWIIWIADSRKMKRYRPGQSHWSATAFVQYINHWRSTTATRKFSSTWLASLHHRKYRGMDFTRMESTISNAWSNSLISLLVQYTPTGSCPDVHCPHLEQHHIKCLISWQRIWYEFATCGQCQSSCLLSLWPNWWMHASCVQLELCHYWPGVCAI